MYDHNTDAAIEVVVAMAVVVLSEEMVLLAVAVVALVPWSSSIIVHEIAMIFPCVVHTSNAAASVISLYCSNSTGEREKRW